MAIKNIYKKIPTIVKTKCEIKVRLLQKFIESNAHLPEQGSVEWLNYKKYKIGGSEISTILGRNKYQTTKNLIESHVGLTKFPSFFAVHWGTLFEEAIRLQINKMYDCDVIETGSIQHPHHNYISLSPDGLAVVEKEIVLFEFKCPHSRLPTGDVPEHYIDQPKLGMHTIDIVDTSIFVEAVFRLTQFSDIIYNNKYNRNYHYKDMTKDGDVLLAANPSSCGVLIMHYVDKETKEISMDIDDLLDGDMEISDSDNTLDELLKGINNKNCKSITIGEDQIYDLGSINSSYMVNKILAGCSCKTRKCLSIEYSTLDNYNTNYGKNEHIDKFNDDDLVHSLTHSLEKNINKIKQNNNKILGIFPYKMMELHINKIERDNSIINENTLDKITEVIDIIKQCDTLEQKEQKEIISEFHKKEKLLKKKK